MINVDSKELLINNKLLPDIQSEEYRPFWQNEVKKIREGVTINGFYFSPFLYWHLNLWSIYVDSLFNGRILRKLDHPQFWNSILPIDETFRRAEEHIDGRKGVAIVGSRRLSKSVIITSKVGHQAIAYQNTESLVSGGNQPDIKNLTDYLDLGIRNLPEYFRFSRIEDDWKKCVTLGFKEKATNIRHEWSKIHVRNFDDGNNTEAAAGLTLSGFLLDEGGKFPFLNALAATTPCFDSPYGWRCSPVITATGGDMKRAGDMQELFNNPEAYNFLAVDTRDDGTSVSLFIPGTQSLKIPRDPVPLSNHLGLSYGSELDDVTIWVADEIKGKEMILKDREQTKKSSGMEAYLKEVMYYPLTPDECFLDMAENIFPVDLLQEQLNFLESGAYKREVDYIELVRGVDGKVTHRPTERKPVNSYPCKPSENNEGVVQIFEFPLQDAPYGLYTAGIDPYKQSQAHYSTSLGAVYIFKRIHNLTGERYQNMIVACYVGRPKKIQTWYEETRKLLDFYGCKALCENMDMGFIDHCIAQRDADKYLEKTPSILREEIHANTTVNRIYGIHTSTGIKDHINSLIIEYLQEVIEVGTDDQGNHKQVLGVSRILDPMLIKELLKFTPKANADRKDAFGYALLMAKNLTRYVSVTDQIDTRYESYYNQNKKKSLFSRAGNPFNRYTRR
jgi:hypothetical protein